MRLKEVRWVFKADLPLSENYPGDVMAGALPKTVYFLKSYEERNLVKVFEYCGV
jgi:hypothetical protein